MMGRPEENLHKSYDVPDAGVPHLLLELDLLPIPNPNREGYPVREEKEALLECGHGRFKTCPYALDE